MRTAVVASPFEIWSRGMKSILEDLGLDLLDADPDSGDGLPLQNLARADLAVLAWRYVSHTRPSHGVRPVDEVFDGRIILVLEPDDEFTADDFVTVDVEGLILSCAAVHDICDCIRNVSRGSRWVDPGVRLLLGHSQHLAQHWQDLSSREQEVARLAGSGLSNKHIARELDLSDGTVKMHMHHILAKLRLGSRVELTPFAEQRVPAHANGHA